MILGLLQDLLKMLKRKNHCAKAIHYTGTVVRRSYKIYKTSRKSSEKIGTGEKGKTPYATVQGYIKIFYVNEIAEKGNTIFR